LNTKIPTPRDVDVWFVSSYTNGQAACVEVKFAKQGGILVRDSKDEQKSAHIVRFSSATWAFLLKIINRHG
jgi:hypothetical protein